MISYTSADVLVNLIWAIAVTVSLAFCLCAYVIYKKHEKP